MLTNPAQHDGVTQVNVAEAKLSDLLERAAAGEDIVIAEHGRPRVRLVPGPVRSEPRRPGALKGQIWIAPDVEDDLTGLFECLQDDGDVPSS